MKCTYCSISYDDSDELREDSEGDLICVECSIVCESCDRVVHNDDGRSANDGSWYCDHCSFSCDRCGDYGHNDDRYSVGNDTWCLGCYESHTFHCVVCSESYSDNDSSYYVNDDTLCEDCYSDNCSYCDRCDESYYDDDGCQSCEGDSGDQRNPCGCRGTIHSYSCKFVPIFRGESKRGLYMGFELETEIHGNLREASEYAYRLQDMELGMLKQDSSIGRNGTDGFEIVTQPCTLAYYQDKSSELWDTIDNLRKNYTARAWDTTTCGLHIHISRAGFSSGAHTHRFISFIYHNADTMIKFAGRKTDYARFNDVWAFDDFDRPYFTLKHKLDRNYRSERMSAVNTNNRDTLELRFFRGTMRPSGVLSALELTHAIAEYTRDLRLDDIKLGALSWEWFCDYVRDNNGLYPNLYDRLPKVSSVDVSKPELLNA